MITEMTSGYEDAAYSSVSNVPPRCFGCGKYVLVEKVNALTQVEYLECDVCGYDEIKGSVLKEHFDFSTDTYTREEIVPCPRCNGNAKRHSQISGPSAVTIESISCSLCDYFDI